MKIKRYFAPDIRQALGQVREDLGAEAVILSNQPVEGGVEIVAAIDYDERALNPAEESAPGRPAPRGAVEWTQDPAITEMRRELQSMRGLLEHQLSSLAWSETTRKNPLRARLVHALRELGLTPSLVQALVAQVPEGAQFEALWSQALALLARAVPLAEDDIVNAGGVVALVGATGVGKTTTLAKLAARCVLTHGARNVALITTDNYRIAAHEQLRAYGSILGLPVQVATGADDLRAALAAFRDRRLVLIDTAGMSQRDLRLSEQFSLLAAGQDRIRSYLVLSATAQSSALVETARGFRNARIAGCILTKLDEATSLGGVLSAAITHRLPVAFVSDGQRVPEDLRPARGPALVSRAVALMHQTREMLQQPMVHQAS